MSTKSDDDNAPGIGDKVTVYLVAGKHQFLVGELVHVFEDGSATLRITEMDGWRKGIKVFIPKSNIAYCAWGGRSF